MQNSRRVFFNLLWILSACASSPKLDTSEVKVDEARLTRTEAQYRKSLVSEPRYLLSFDLNRDSTAYTGKVEIKFQWHGHEKDTLWVDFNGGTVSDLKVNSKSVDYRQTKARVIIPGNSLAEGENLVAITFKHDFSADGAGFYRFVDPEDKSVYAYTALEPFDANKVFPCFDQPDLKAQFEMTIDAPKDWVIATYDRESSVTNKGDQKEWVFPKSLPIATYVWSIHAGPFRVWNDEKARIPSRLFARRTLARYVNAEDWFTITREGLDFYEKYFNEPYAFKKYDQIIAPDFNAGAMENIAAVTFSEGFVSRGGELHSKKRHRAGVILHEMAHMWFGNLVTMEWWNDLWLNESFATYMSYLAMSKATEFSGVEAWRDFSDEKSAAYWIDLSVITHPIEAKIKTTDDAFDNFDGITYEKGASLIKQLSFYLGADNFQKGMWLYFGRHRYSNSRLEDFVNALAEASGRDLSHWSKDWLKTKGLNRLSFTPQCEGSKLVAIRFKQNVANGDSVSRSQRTKLGLYGMAKGGLQSIGTLEVEYSGSSGKFVPKEETACPKFIFPNQDDEAYLVSSYTQEDIKILVENFTALDNPFLRQMLLRDLWLSVRRGEIALSDFSELIYRALGSERDEANLEVLLHLLKNPYEGGSLYAYTDFEKGENLERFEDLIWELSRKNPKNSEMRNILTKFYISFVMSPHHQKNLLDLLSAEKAKRLGVGLDQDERWSIVQQLSMLGHPEAKSLMKKELARDSSHKGHESYLGAQAFYPDKDQKRQLFDRIVNNNPPATAEQVRIIARHLFPANQRSLAAQFQKDFFVALEKVRTSFEPERLTHFLGLIPEECFVGKVGKINDYLQTAKKLAPVVEKELQTANQEDSICRLVRAKKSPAIKE